MRRITFRFIVAVTTFFTGIGVVTYWLLNNSLPVVDLPQPPPECALESVEEISPSRIELAERIKILAIFQELPFEQAIGVDESYRLIWFPTFDAPTVVRIWRSGENFSIKIKRLSGKGGYELGTLEIEKTRLLTAEEWNDFVNLINNKCFWITPSAIKEVPVMDGAFWVFEGVNNGRYHTISRISPSSQMTEIFRHLFGLTDVKTEYESYLPTQTTTD